MELKLGHSYKFRDDLTDEDGLPCRKEFPFGNKVGIYFGRTVGNWPRFRHGKSESCVNLKDECFEEVNAYPEGEGMKKNRTFINKTYFGSDGKDFQKDFIEYLKEILSSNNYSAMSEHQLYLQDGKKVIEEIIEELE